MRAQWSLLSLCFAAFRTISTMPTSQDLRPAANLEPSSRRGPHCCNRDLDIPRVHRPTSRGERCRNTLVLAPGRRRRPRFYCGYWFGRPRPSHLRCGPTCATVSRIRVRTTDPLVNRQCATPGSQRRRDEPDPAMARVIRRRTDQERLNITSRCESDGSPRRRLSDYPQMMPRFDLVDLYRWRNSRDVAAQGSFSTTGRSALYRVEWPNYPQYYIPTARRETPSTSSMSSHLNDSSADRLSGTGWGRRRVRVEGSRVVHESTSRD